CKWNRKNNQRRRNNFANLNIRNRSEENKVTNRKELLLMNIGTISTRFITDNFIEALKEEGSFTLTAVYSRTEEKAAYFAKKQVQITILQILKQWLIVN